MPAFGLYIDNETLRSKKTYIVNDQSPNEIPLIAEIAVSFRVLPHLFLTSLIY